MAVGLDMTTRDLPLSTYASGPVALQKGALRMSLLPNVPSLLVSLFFVQYAMALAMSDSASSALRLESTFSSSGVSTPNLGGENLPHPTVPSACCAPLN